METRQMNTPTGSKDFQKRNPHLFPINPMAMYALATSPPKRLRQSSKPLMNKLEQKWFDQLMLDGPKDRIVRAQAMKFRLANGLWYYPDFFAFDWPILGEASGPVAWETKGKWVDGDSFPKLKMFAATYPEIRVILVWKDENKQWQQQRILA